MGRNRAATSLFIGILICVPLLALYNFGVFIEAARWLGDRLPRFLVLPTEGLHHSKPLQYAYYTLLAFSSAWLCLELPQTWKKYLYLLAIAFLTLLMTPILALNGLLFEPFSGTLAAWFAGLLGVMLSDGPDAEVPLQKQPPVVEEAKPASDQSELSRLSITSSD